jgi:ubiquinol-cytochrome c reductase cytochrome b subunit
MSTTEESIQAPAHAAPTTKGGTVGYFIDDRLASANFTKRLVDKVFPDHWSFMLGEVALYSFIVLLLTGTYLTLFFNPSMTEVIYNGSYVPLKGIKMSEAYSSTLAISFDVRGGLLMRQIHHWAALFFTASVSVHLLRVFFTGAFRKPREINWVIGTLLLVLALLEGFSGYSLPDDLLSGTGLRIAEGIMQAIPLVGTYVAMFLFGGEFPGTDIMPRLYSIHILLIPGILLALITVHLIMVFYQKHTQFPGPGRTESNVVGFRLFPIYMAKAGGFFFVVFGITVLIAALVTINPVWLYGPYTPSQVTAGSQPDWYIGWLDGAVRLMPNLESHILGHTLSWNILVPALVIPGIMFTALGLYPWIEAWATGDKREHHLLDRPRNAPTRTGLGVMSLAFYMILVISGGNDIIASAFNLSINQITWGFRFLLFIIPPLAFVVTKRICLGLQRRDNDKLLHGYETGRILRLPSGEFLEIHEPIGEAEKAKLLAKADVTPLELPSKVDANGVKNPKAAKSMARAKLSQWFYSDVIPTPTDEEMQAAAEHAAHELHAAESHLKEISQH